MIKTLVSLLLLIAPTVSASGQGLRGSQDDAIFCHLFVATGSEAAEHGDETLIKYQCMFDDDESRRRHHIDLPQSFLKEHQTLVMQNPILRIPGGVVTKHTVHVPVNADITVHADTSPRRKLAPKSGTPRALSVRVIANGNKQPRESKSELQGRVFGIGPDAEANTVFTQYKKCSFGAQDIQPATEGNGVESGVVEVTAPIDIASCDILGDCQQTIIAATERKLGLSPGSLDSSNPPYDFVMFCMPDGTMFGENGRTTWAAFAYTGDRTAFFQNGYCGVMTTNMHELGHLMDFGHSNEGNTIREDKSGALGRSITQIGGPNYCLNGHKFALSGWMDDRKKVVNLSTSDNRGYTGRLVAFVDKEANGLVNADKTLLEINTGAAAPNAYVLYNRKKSFNDGVREKGDMVTVVQQSQTRDNESEMVGGLNSGETVTIPGTSIVVEVCGLESENNFDFAKVSVYDTSRGQSSTCNVALNQQPPAPAPPVPVPPAPPAPAPPAPAPPAPAPPAPAPAAPAPAATQCQRLQIGQNCRRSGQCCSGTCAGTGWSQTCQ
jgi:hypothetical protein